MNEITCTLRGIIDPRTIIAPNSRRKRRRSTVHCALLIIVSFLAAASVDAQTDDDLATAPPPLKTISNVERDKLDREKGVKSRTKLALNLMDDRLKRAEALFSRDDLENTFAELGVFHALMDDTLAFLGGNGRPNRKVLFNLKRFEIGLRKFTPRLELIRRELPLTHEFYVRSLLKLLREARTKATEPLFGETVLPDNEI